MRIAVIAFALLLFACPRQPPAPHPFDDLLNRADVVTLTNLHPDEAASRLYATNYQQIGLIPICTRVTLLERNAKRLLFRNEANGKTYEYVYHPSAVEPLPDHLQRYFGTECPQKKLDALDEVDRRGVALGKPITGMTKAGVVLAMGYPPPHVTPSLDANRWIYWLGRFEQEVVVFDDGGRVIAIDKR
jgi:hypothetical protein